MIAQTYGFARRRHPLPIAESRRVQSRGAVAVPIEAWFHRFHRKLKRVVRACGSVIKAMSSRCLRVCSNGSRGQSRSNRTRAGGHNSRETREANSTTGRCRCIIYGLDITSRRQEGSEQRTFTKVLLYQQSQQGDECCWRNGAPRGHLAGSVHHAVDFVGRINVGRSPGYLGVAHAISRGYFVEPFWRGRYGKAIEDRMAVCVSPVCSRSLESRWSGCAPPNAEH